MNSGDLKMEERTIVLRKGKRKESLSLDQIANLFFDGRKEMVDFFLDSTINQRARFSTQIERYQGFIDPSVSGLLGAGVGDRSYNYYHNILRAQLKLDPSVFVSWWHSSNPSYEGRYDSYSLKWSKIRRRLILFSRVESWDHLEGGDSPDKPFAEFKSLIERYRRIK